MPVNLGTNLKMETTHLSAYYTDLFNKLNKAYAWVNGDIIVYTTKSASVGNNIYHDTSLNVVTTITSKTDTTITGGGVTYTRDSTNDSTFKSIPYETESETLTINDFLRVTNPNS